MSSALYVLEIMLLVELNLQFLLTITEGVNWSLMYFIR